MMRNVRFSVIFFHLLLSRCTPIRGEIVLKHGPIKKEGWDMSKRDMARWFEYAGYTVLAYVLFWGLWVFLNPDGFEVFSGTARNDHSL